MTLTSDKQEQSSWVTHAQIRRCAEKAIAVVERRLSLRVPKTEQERAHGFALWLEGWRAKIWADFQSRFLKEFNALSTADVDAEAVQQFTQKHVWPHWEQPVWEHFQPKLLSYALLGQACIWGRKNIGDAALYGDPRPDGNLWRVTLGVPGYGENLGQITLDADGSIVLDQTTTRQELLKHTHDLTPLSAGTADA